MKTLYTPARGQTPWFIHRMLGVAAIAALMLTACGGRVPEVESTMVPKPTSSAPVPTPVPAPVSTPAPAPVSTPEPVHWTTELAGLYLYSNTPNQVEYLGLAIPPASSNGNTEFFAWERQLNTGNPWLYNGFFVLGLDGNAQSNSDGITQVKGNYAPTRLSVTLTQASKKGLSASMTDTKVVNPSPSIYTASSVQTGFKFEANALLNDLSPGWTGTWFDSGSSFAQQALQFPESGQVKGINLGNCPLDLSLQPGSGGNYYRATAVVYPQSDPTKGICHWTPKSASLTLKGVALIWNTGSQVQLDMMLLDGTGAGISYRGKH